jgi:hypothetical protein
MRILVVLVTVVLSTIGTLRAQPAPALNILVLEGEGGVNIIQQKTAVRPLIEVRDRNNIPVAGASVTFTIGGGGQGAVFAGGAQTLTVTTNAAGQAAASGLNAVSSGAFQIQVQAAYQGQVATAAISQTNFATAAAAAQAGAGSGGTATGAGGGAAGGGGGVSGTTLGIVGAAVAGGAVAATQVVGKEEKDGVAAGTAPAGPSVEVYNGSFSSQIVLPISFTTPQGIPGSCSRTRSVTGTMRIELDSNHATGTARMQVSQTDISVTGTCILAGMTNFSVGEATRTTVSGGPSALSFTHTAPIGNETDSVEYTGSLSGNTISGILRLTIVMTGGGGTMTTSVTLQR